MIRKIIASAVVLILIFSVLTAGCVSGSKYYVGVDPDGTDPFIILDETTGELSGFDVESMKWIAEHEKMNIEFKIMGWDNIIPSLQAGEIDMIYSDMSVTDERKERISFSVPYYSIKIAVAGNKMNDVVTMDDFFEGNMIIGVPSGTTSEDYARDTFADFDRRVNEKKIIVYDEVDSMFSALEKGEIQTAVFEDNYIKQFIKENENIYLLGETGVSEDIAVGLRQENIELIEKINHGLTDLMASDKWTELRQKYGI